MTKVMKVADHFVIVGRCLVTALNGITKFITERHDKYACTLHIIIQLHEVSNVNLRKSVHLCL